MNNMTALRRCAGLLAVAALLLPTIAARAEETDPIGDAWHDGRNPIVRIFGGERLNLWSLKPIQRVTPPAVKDSPHVRNPIDNFIVARLKPGLQLSPPADRRTLARRLYFDLIGLPPKPEQMARFLADERADAYERLVDEMLASPQYGEHAARLWLDVVRYSDSNGFDWDEFRPNAWRFRDYVIRSLNADKPFDQFVREQLAGDELLEGPPRTPAEQDMLIATTYLRLGPQDNSSALFNEQARSRYELMADLVETTGSAFLGLTMACCRCHDHKHDPISQADHYRLRAFFEPVRYADDVPLNLADEQEEIRRHNEAIDAKIGEIQQQQDQIRDEVKQRLRAPRIEKLTPEERKLLESPQEGLSDDAKKQIAEVKAKVEPPDQEVQAAYTEEEKQRDAPLAEEIKKLQGERREFEAGLLMTDSAEDVPATHVLYQGDHKNPREAVAPGFLSALDPNPAKIEAAANKQTKGRRLALANWIVSPENPLTARVLVNRLWQQHFGRGLVATPNDFGLAGSRPTHPELLDYLASEVAQGGWSIKKLQRLIVTSATYRQSSVRTGDENEGENKLYARQSLRRLSAEQLRDTLLSVSGLLTPKTGGSPVWPQLPTEVLSANPAFFDDNATKTKGWYPSPPHLQHARSVYLVQKRTVRVPLMEAFDLPENSTSCARRTTSIVAPQAFTLLNSPLAVEAAKAFAQRVRREAGDDPRAQVRRVFLLALQREPGDDELTKCLALLEQRGLAELCRVALNLNEFIYID